MDGMRKSYRVSDIHSIMFTLSLNDTQAGYLIRMIEADGRNLSRREEDFLNMLHAALSRTEGESLNEVAEPKCLSRANVCGK